MKYRIGVMITPIESGVKSIEPIVREAVDRFDQFLADIEGLKTMVFDFEGPHLTPIAGKYSPLDFLQLGISEKIEREIDFLLVVTEVDLTASRVPFVVALPSRLANIGIITVRRLSPSFWGHPADPEKTSDRLVALMLHTLGHLLNLPHEDSSTNVMFNFQAIEDLDEMTDMTRSQAERMQANFPVEAPEEISRDKDWRFAIAQAMANRQKLIRAILKANPLKLLASLPTMLTAALSLIIVLFFSAETWDISGAVEWYQLALFSSISLVIGTSLLYRSFSLRLGRNRRQQMAETVVVIQTATLASFFLTQLMLNLTFLTGVIIAAETIFPRPLMTTWSTGDPVTELLDHVRLGTFLGAMAVLGGSLASRADSSELVRRVLFIDEET